MSSPIQTAKDKNDIHQMAATVSLRRLGLRNAVATYSSINDLQNSRKTGLRPWGSVKQPLRAGREERYRQNDLLPLISYQHHQSWIVVPILLPQALDCTLCVGKCRRFVRQKCAVRIVLFSSVRPSDGEKISGHCYLIEISPHACEASYTQSMKVTCRNWLMPAMNFCRAGSRCFVHYERTFAKLHKPLNEKICGCRIGTPVVIRVTSMPACRRHRATPSRKFLESGILRPSAISQRMTG
jgi:hypothetical protein